MAGKGSAPRKGRDDSKYASNWDRLFGNKSGQEVVQENKYEEFMTWLGDCPFQYEVELDEDSRVNVTFHL